MTETAPPDPPPPRGGAAQVPALTGFRALAAAMVFFGHAAERWGRDHSWVVKYGWSGVNLFFALSGFLFTLLYFDAFVAGAVSLREYFLKRVFRVLPLTWALVLLTVATAPRVELADIVAHLTLTNVYFPLFRYTINPPMWTLGVEESFYLVVPALFTGLGAVERARPAASALARVLAVALCLVLLTEAGIALTTDVLTLRRAVFGTWDHALWSVTLLARFSDFGCGIFAGLVALRFPRSPALRSPAVATALVALGAAVWFGAARWIETHGGPDGASVHPAYQIATRLFSVGAALAIFGLYGRSWLTALFASRPFVYAGRISFALYLSQDAVVGRALLSASLAREVQRFVHREGVALLVLYALHSAVAAALHHGVEDPAQRLLRRRFLRRREAPGPAVET
ncbi:MAG: Conserved putative rane protein [Myxococcaceae bacterium]|nr:Conserved putative rane protein [Myxococcaceae bacterium]